MTCARCALALCICRVARPGWSRADVASALAIAFGLIVMVIAAVWP